MIVKKIEVKKAYHSGEVAYLLRMCLGPLREWADFLADCRQHKTNYKGHTILPVLRVHDGKAYRPVYLGSEVKKFITNVLNSCPEAKPKVRPTAIFVEIDPLDTRIWKLKKVA